MKTIMEFFSNIVITLMGSDRSIIRAALLFSLVVFLINALSIIKTKDNLFISRLIEDDFNSYRESKRKKKEAANSLGYLMQHGYSAVAYGFVFVSKFIFGALFAYACVQDGVKEICNNFFGIDSSLTFVKFFTQEDGLNAYFIVVALAATVLQAINNVFLDEDRAMDRKTIDTQKLFFTFFGCALLPTGFSVFWAVHTTIENIYLFVCLKLFASACERKAERTLSKFKN